MKAQIAERRLQSHAQLAANRQPPSRTAPEH
jgi:hypothetical protein